MCTGLCVQRHCCVFTESRICPNSVFVMLRHITDLSVPLRLIASNMARPSCSYVRLLTPAETQQHSGCQHNMLSDLIKGSGGLEQTEKGTVSIKAHRECTHIIYIIWLGVIECYTETGRTDWITSSNVS